MSDQPFHEGEIAVQERAGERDIARRHGVIIASRIPPGALTFLAQQRLIAVSVAGDDPGRDGGAVLRREVTLAGALLHGDFALVKWLVAHVVVSQ